MNPSTKPHAAHDELLLARLFGDDVTPAERARATAQITACPDCAAFFADVGAISDATRAMPVPARPRDFTLTPADAARLEPRASSMLGWIGRTRALGASMTAIGLAGMVIVGAVSAFGPVLSSAATAASPGNLTIAQATAAPAMPQLGSSADTFSGAEASQVSAPVPAASDQVPPRVTAVTTSPTALPLPSFAPASPAASASPVPVDHSSPEIAALPTARIAQGSPAESGPTSVGYDTNGKSVESQASAPQRVPMASGSNGPSGPDPGLIALASFAAILVAGLLLLAIPRLSARRAMR